jgi:adenylate cyclase
VVEQIVRDPSKLKLGGEERELTAFFSDIQGFTSISEQLGSPSRLVELLNEYLSAMADIIESYEGTIDKYEGDAVIAFWGAPVFFEDHALKACLSALDQQKRFAKLREAWEKGGKWPPAVAKARVRMGLNTGLMVVGNMGSRGRMNYTIMGDAVNLASRLEGVNKQYGTLITISETTYLQVKEHLEVRELDIIRVVGKAEPVKIYELLARKGELNEEMKTAIKSFSEALALYRERSWEKAIEKFESVLKILSGDPPSEVYIQRCRAFIQNPPPDDWDGVFEMKTK